MSEATTTVIPHAALSEHDRAHHRTAWIATVDHKRIGILYMLTGLFFFVVGGLEALFIRLQLAVPNNTLVSPNTFNQLFTMHGTTMIFLVVMPVVFGLANYMIPLQIGARDMAFPRLNAFSYWMLPLGAFLLHFSIIAGGAPAVGWFAYAPLSETPYSSLPGVDYWAIALLVLGIGSVATSINIIVTVLCLRTPGMTMRRLPLFTWMSFVNSFLVILALPVLNAGLVMLLIDRQFDAHFFQPAGGGSAVMWQHIFWAFGHPEVYILVLPAFGIISEVIPVFSRKPIFGYEFVAGSTVAIGILSFGVWGHHMFTVGMGHTLDIFFAAASLLIAIPTGVKVLNWSATLVGGRIRFSVAMLFCLGFLVHFLCGGLSGITHAVAPLDWQTKNSYYLVAHFHFVAVGGIAFAVMAGLYYWFPKISGRMLSESVGKWTFWFMVIGFNLTFVFQHALGFAGMPRRVYTYPDLPGWGWMNFVSTIGAFFMAVAGLLLVWSMARALFRTPTASDNPWDAWTLEWATTSPPPPENFQTLPPIHSRRPLWDDANPDRPDPVVGSDTVVSPVAEKSKAGMVAFIGSEAGFFGVLILAFLYFNATPGADPGTKDLSLLKTSIFSVCLFASSFTFWRSEVSQRRGEHRAMVRWLVTTIVLGGIFIIGQGMEYWGLFKSGVKVGTNLFATSFFTLTGFHGLHVSIGLIAMMIVLGLAAAGDFKKARPPALEAVGLYWHFVDVVWVFVFTAVYIFPLLR